MLTTTMHGSGTVIAPHGDIDHETLPDLLDTVPELPASVTHLTWDFRQTAFIDVAGLHLLDQQRHACRDADRVLVVTHLAAQPLRLLHLAHELCPAEHWDDFLPDRGATAA
ncbi:STAS domain-containing protein [Streptomyces apricus]|uniref:STAS domain-containing protein n=1 Tax=Streptomyces apricus TaxID=1828112 RepID=A0A5B0BKW8_9ACTN|nr:STAS domain-containing protein [Streptomyces apricus]KAA0941539.1 STAS domain-containing protein [Streptomyces apricus]